MQSSKLDQKSKITEGMKSVKNIISSSRKFSKQNSDDPKQGVKNRYTYRKITCTKYFSWYKTFWYFVFVPSWLLSWFILFLLNEWLVTRLFLIMTIMMMIFAMYHMMSFVMGVARYYVLCCENGKILLIKYDCSSFQFIIMCIMFCIFYLILYFHHVHHDKLMISSWSQSPDEECCLIPISPSK